MEDIISPSRTIQIQSPPLAWESECRGGTEKCGRWMAVVVLMPPGKVKRRYHRKGECGVLCTILMDFRDYHNNTKRSSSVSLIFLWATQSQPYTIGVCVGVGEAVLIINGRRGALLRIMCGIEMWSDLWVCEIAFLKGANLWRFSSFFLF